MPTYVVAGTEKVEIAPAFFKEADAESAEWIELNYVSEDNPPLYTKNADTITVIRSLEKNGDTITLSTKGEANVLTVGILQQPPNIMALLDNIEYSPDTTQIIELSDRKIANLAIRLTSLPVKDGRKLITTIPNTDVTNTTPGGGANNSVQQILMNATVGTFETTVSKKRAIAIKRWVKADGTAIDSTPVVTPEPTPTP